MPPAGEKAYSMSIVSLLQTKITRPFFFPSGDKPNEAFATFLFYVIRVTLNVISINWESTKTLKSISPSSITYFLTRPNFLCYYANGQDTFSHIIRLIGPRRWNHMERKEYSTSEGGISPHVTWGPGRKAVAMVTMGRIWCGKQWLRYGCCNLADSSVIVRFVTGN